MSGLRVMARHGVLPEERERAQPFEIDLEMEADLHEAGERDELALTVDYGEVIERVAALAATTSFELIEALAEAVAGCVLSEAKVRAVTVTVRKMHPPVAADVSYVGVRLRREKR